MKTIWIYVIIALVSVAILVIPQIIKGNMIKKLSKLLYEKHDPDGFLAEINSTAGKILFSKKTRLFQSVDAYALKQDNAAIENVFSQLEDMKIGYGMSISLYEKEVQYYVGGGKFDKAKAANSKLQREGGRIEDKQMKSICEECDSLIRIYADHDGSLAKTMVEKGDEAKSQQSKGIYYYQAAKCFNYQKDRANTIKYLKEAQQKLAGTSWTKHIDSCLQDFSHLEEK